MISTLILHLPGYWFAFLVLVTLVFAVDRLGLLLWVAGLNQNQREESGPQEHWRVHR